VNPLSALFQPFSEQRDRWFLWLPVFIASGIAVYFALPFEPPGLYLLATPSAALLAFGLRRKGAFLPVVLLALALGFNAAQLETRLAATPMLDEAVPPSVITGTLFRAESLPDGARLTLKDPFIRKAPQTHLPFLRMNVRSPMRELPPTGARVAVWGPLWPPGEPTTPGGYDFRRGAFFKHLSATGFSYGDVRVREGKPARSFALTLERVRRVLALRTFARLPPDEAPMTAALLTGNQSGIDREVMNAMRLSGLSHLLSISGVHVSMIALLLYAPVRALLALFPFIALRWPIKKIAAVVSILGTALYTLLVGADPPTVRSALMTSLVLFAIIVDRKALSLRLVGLAAGCVMLAAPSGVIGPSFQMSFAAVLAMVAAFEKRLDTTIKEGLAFELPTWLRHLGRAGRTILLTSLVATAATTPFTLFHFQTFSFYGVIANMIAIPLTTFWVMPCLLLTYLTTPFGLEGLVLDGAGLGIKATIWLAQHVAAWPFSQFCIKPMPLWAFGLFVIGGLWLCLWRGRLRLWGLVAILVACFYPLTVTLPYALIAPEGDVWGVQLNDGRFAIYGKKPNSFILYQWRTYLAQPEIVPFSPKDEPALNGELTCTATSCLAQHGGFKMIFMKEVAPSDALENACASGAAALFVPEALTISCAVPLVIDAKARSARGAYAITITQDGPRIQTARQARGQRPWSVGTNPNVPFSF